MGHRRRTRPRRHPADVRRTFAGDPVAPDASGYDGVVVMGGPMSACSDEGFASRQAEVALLRDALGRALPTLGVCLGAQLLALAAGGLVYPGADGPEIGWSAVELLATSDAGCALRRIPATTAGAALARRHVRPAAGRATAGADRALPQPGLPGRRGGLGAAVPPGGNGRRGGQDSSRPSRATPPGPRVASRRAASHGGVARRSVPWRDLVFDRFAALVGTDAAHPGRWISARFRAIFLNRELWQIHLPLRQLRPTSPAWSLTRRSPRSPRACARSAPGRA